MRPRNSPSFMGRILLSGAQRLSGLFSSSQFYYTTTRSPSAILSSYSLRAPLCRSARPRSFATMASDLPASVEALTLQSTQNVSKYPSCFPTLNPMDIYREHIATKLSEATDIDAELIYTRLAWTNTLDKGDLALPVCEYSLLSSVICCNLQNKNIANPKTDLY